MPREEEAGVKYLPVSDVICHLSCGLFFLIVRHLDALADFLTLYFDV